MNLELRVLNSGVRITNRESRLRAETTHSGMQARIIIHGQEKR
jgi:hypothetical protein